MFWRWVIRGVGLLLVLLCVGGWVGSYRYMVTVEYRHWRVKGYAGEVLVIHDPSWEADVKRVGCWVVPVEMPAYWGSFEPGWMGFRYHALEISSRVIRFGHVPMWFLTVAAGAAGAVGWWGTRGRRVDPRRAFPVEVGRNSMTKFK